MKNNNCLKRIFIFWLLTLSIVSIQAGPLFDTGPKLSINNSSLVLKYQLPTPREFIPRSIKGRIASTEKKFSKEKGSNIECNKNALCSSFEGNKSIKNVSSWIGFEYKYRTEKYFIATYGQQANHIGNSIYSTKEWKKQHFWINLGKKSVPFPLQLRYVGIDAESGHEWYTVDYIGYRIANAGIDYSNYADNMSTSLLVLLINPKNKEVDEYHLEYYDENSEYIGDYQIKIEDKIESYFIGLKKDKEATYLFSLEGMTTVTNPITFSYKEQYPGKDFSCTNCGELDLSQTEFKYIFEAYGEKNSNFTEPKPIVTKASLSSNADSTTKAVPLSGFWIFFLLTMGYSYHKIKKD